MSRSIKGVIAFGKSTRGGASRSKETYGDFQAEKSGYKLQTKEDYITYVRGHFNIGTLDDMYDRRRCEEYIRFLNDRKETEELIVEFAMKLYTRDKSK